VAHSETLSSTAFRPLLLDRREKLELVSRSAPAEHFRVLLADVDAALERIDDGSFGLCDVCHDPIEEDRLAANPLTRFCVDHLSPSERISHQRDLELANQVQSRMLPARDMVIDHWDARYSYVPLGAVSGDYCDLIPLRGGSLFFAVGDVAGKGIAASLMMTHLSAVFRVLLSLDLPLADVVARANVLLCENTLTAQYATLACGIASRNGIEICNAGHCPPLLLRPAADSQFASNGLPLGLFSAARHDVSRQAIEAGDTLILYSDGITEAEDPQGEQFGTERLLMSLRANSDCDAQAMADGVIKDVARFCGTGTPEDDMTLLVLRSCR
jgi:sigma-B regulation protein RsbU (phosphoserine phosphatase)